MMHGESDDLKQIFPQRIPATILVWPRELDSPWANRPEADRDDCPDSRDPSLVGQGDGEGKVKRLGEIGGVKQIIPAQPGWRVLCKTDGVYWIEPVAAWGLAEDLADQGVVYPLIREQGRFSLGWLEAARWFVQYLAPDEDADKAIASHSRSADGPDGTLGDLLVPMPGGGSPS